MKITKNQLRKIIEAAFPVKGKAVGNFIKKGRAGRVVTMQGRDYLDLGKGHWQGPDGEKLNWVELSSMASALVIKWSRLIIIQEFRKQRTNN